MSLFKKKNKVYTEEKIPEGIEIEGEDEVLDEDTADYSDDVTPSEQTKDSTPAPAEIPEDSAPDEIPEDVSVPKEPISFEDEDPLEGKLPETPEESIAEDNVPEDNIAEDPAGDVEDDIGDDATEDSPGKAKRRINKKVIIALLVLVVVAAIGAYAVFDLTKPEEEPAVFIAYDITDWQSASLGAESAAVKYLLYGEHTVTNPNATQIRDLTFRFYPSGKYSGHSQHASSILGTWDVEVTDGVMYLVVTSKNGNVEKYTLELNTQTELITLTDDSGVYVIHYLDGVSLAG